MLTLRALLPHVQIAGGVRRFLELGNHFTARGHQFSVFKPDVTPPDWFPCKFWFRPLDTVLAHPYDVTLCGDTGLLHLLGRAPTRLRVLVALGDRYADKYIEFLRDHPETLVLGNSSAWTDYLPGARGLAVPGGINLEQFCPGPRTPGPWTVTVVGRVDKGREAIPVVLEAFRSLGWRDARLRIVSDVPGSLPWRFFRIRRQVEFADGRNQAALVRHYRDSDAFVTMERTAGWSNPACEAMACGIPVICTRHGTGDFADASTALVVPQDDPGALAGALQEVRSRPADAQARAAAGLERVKKFEWSRVADGMLRVFEECLARSGGSLLDRAAQSGA